MYYKTLTIDGTGPYSGVKWNLPDGDKPGGWMPRLDGKLVVCSYGYHLCRKEDLVRWLNAEIYIAEIRGGIVTVDDKVVCREARLVKRLDTWNARTARLFACDCADRVLPIFEKRVPNDTRPREAIAVAREFAEGRAKKERLVTASDTAWLAASATAWDAGRAAAWAAGRAAEYNWQTERLFWYLDGGRNDAKNTPDKNH